MAISKDEVKDFIKSMTVLELSVLIKELEEDLGVSATAAVAAPVSAAGGEAAVVEEQTEFDVILDSAGMKKIQVIKVLREITSLGLKEAKALADNAPSPVKEAVSKEEAESIKAKIEEKGGVVTVK